MQTTRQQYLTSLHIWLSNPKPTPHPKSPRKESKKSPTHTDLGRQTRSTDTSGEGRTGSVRKGAAWTSRTLEARACPASRRERGRHAPTETCNWHRARWPAPHPCRQRTAPGGAAKGSGPRVAPGHPPCNRLATRALPATSDRTLAGGVPA